MDIFGIAGWSGSGKTTLIRALIPVLSAQGRVVGTIKHSHHDLSLDPGAAIDGAVETLVASAQRFSLTGDVPQDEDAKLPYLGSRLAGIDLLLVEGFKFYHHPRLEVWNSTLGKPMLVQDDRRIIATVTDTHRPESLGQSTLWFHRDDVVGIAGFIQKACVSMSAFRH
ncbi:molybdopterin-guanine dinucleotide biosynthesis protein B [Magnetospirillum sp. 64-120]|uniref:molybdopterin-guanine dinucleotide biosynthesis protein B n=1 Tax=Magnetospirillum sp. 64-120 TaxID=1895778 RepID=UPI00092CDDBF|nr:molybdopterin-guanine dinucleotide biosynthesis protein B [Magnetospirillum sp. 64-120]OJX81236.1 MAG: molybdopterin-guanine dinucleotide biosynthesis protein B [Magnetospirillum sp. 64-120]